MAGQDESERFMGTDKVAIFGSASCDPVTSEGKLCGFRNMEEFSNGIWTRSDFLIPALMRRVRWLESGQQ